MTGYPHKLAEENAEQFQSLMERQRRATAVNKVEYCRLGELVDMLGADKPIRMEHFIAPTFGPVSQVELDGTVSFILRVKTHEYNVLMGMHDPEFALADLDEVDAELDGLDG